MNNRPIDSDHYDIDQDGLNELGHIYKKHRKAFIGFAKKKYGLRESESIDIYQDAIIALYRNMKAKKTLDLKSSIKTYLFAIGKYMIINSLKSKKREKRISLQNLDLQRYDVPIEENHSGVDKIHLMRLRKCLREISPKCRELLNLIYFNGLTNTQITEFLNYSNTSVLKTRKSQCLKSLRLKMNSYGK